jgi:hypothetical protein
MKYYYLPILDVTNYISNYCIQHNFKKILEIGPGINCFPLTTHFVDYKIYDETMKEKTTIVDVSKDKLPFQDEEFDFVYCRHVIEDMYNPFLLLDEMKRVATAGYIETPNPLIEMSYGIDFYGSCACYRGYIHHRYLCCNDNGTLKLLTKYPIIEHIETTLDNRLDLLQNEYNWNTYYLWDRKNGNDLNYRYYQMDLDYEIIEIKNKMDKKKTKYIDELFNFVNIGLINANNFSKIV